MFSCEFCKIFKNIYFEEHLWTTASGSRLENHVEIEPQRFTAFNLFSYIDICLAGSFTFFYFRFFYTYLFRFLLK